MSLRGTIAIVGLGATDAGALHGRGATELCADAARRALADAGLKKDSIDGLVTCNTWVESHLYHAEMFSEYLHPQFDAPYGMPLTGSYALAARAHMHEFGTTPEQLAAVAVAARSHATLNPAAEMREPLEIRDVLESPLVADPLHQLDCSLWSDGGAAVVATAAERARDFPHDPVYLLGVGEGHWHEHLFQARSLVTTAASESAPRAYEMAGVGPSDVDFAEVYDCFTSVAITELEDLGFCKKGEGGPFVEDGNISPGSALPVNTHGGLLSHSHTGHPGSMFALTEAVTQLFGEAGKRQVEPAELGLVHGQGGVLSSHCTLILGTEAAR